MDQKLSVVSGRTLVLDNPVSYAADEIGNAFPSVLEAPEKPLEYATASVYQPTASASENADYPAWNVPNIGDNARAQRAERSGDGSENSRNRANDHADKPGLRNRPRTL